jgi:hypothetical protein
MTLIFLKYFLGKISLLSHLYYEKGKNREKKEYPPFSPTTQPHPRNNSLKKKNSLPLPIALNKTPLFFKFTKTPHH